MSRYYQDILQQPVQLTASLRHHMGEGKAAMQEALKVLSHSRPVFIVGIGASWNAGLAVQSALNSAGIMSYLCEAAEFYHYTRLPEQSVVLFLSRSGKSVEVVHSMEKCRRSGATVIAITNDPASPLGKGADICLSTAVAFDHAISVNTYSSILLTGYLLGQGMKGHFAEPGFVRGVEQVLSAMGQWIQRWEEAIDGIEWPASSSYYFLARGSSLASAYESALLWEEAAKYPATAMPTGTFRHGPQEIIREGIHITLWIDNGPAREYDWQLAGDMQTAGAKVLVIGSQDKAPASFPLIEMPRTPAGMEPLMNIIPMQLAAWRFATIRGEDSDGFRYCTLVVEKEGGL